MTYTNNNWLKPMTDAIWNFFKICLHNGNIDLTALTSMVNEFPGNTNDKAGIIYAISSLEYKIENEPDKAFKYFQEIITEVYKLYKTYWDMLTNSDMSKHDEIWGQIIEAVTTKGEKVACINTTYSGAVKILFISYTNIFESQYKQFIKENNKAA